MGNAGSKATGQEAETVLACNNTVNEMTMMVNKDQPHKSDTSDRKLRPRKTPSRRKSLVQCRDDEQPNLTRLSEDQVHVNLAMNDLMAYLQVVANNSPKLPLTRRDDPDLVVNSKHQLGPDEYARKSEAFIPADVRVIGATFQNYGNVWDLPTSEEYNVSYGAQEPGRSYGGACTNAMLKVLYDAASNEGDAVDHQAETNALFEDDDDDEAESSFGRSFSGFKSGFSLDQGVTGGSNITWAELLKKMQSEMFDIEYPLIPKISSTRKLDLNQTFTLVPENYERGIGTKRSLLIACNYNNIPEAQLKASHDDVRSMKDYIVNVHGFPETPGLMTILMDDDDHKHPTFMNIVDAFKKLSEESRPGDAVFVQFSGHGGRVLDAPPSDAPHSYDEVIVPTDYQQSGLIRDTLIFKTLLAPMRYGVTVTMMFDCCTTGMLVELPYGWAVNHDDLNPEPVSNDAFSFVRFLKVVKTMYDTSTFTQLGKAVDSALVPSVVITVTEETELTEPETVVPSDTEKNRRKVPITQESILDAFTDVCHKSTRGDPTVDCDGQDTQCAAEAISKRDEAPRLSLLEQVMNCTFSGNDEDEFFSDDDETTTYKTKTEDTEGVNESYDSLTEDEEDFQSKRRKHRSFGRTSGGPLR